MKNDYNDLMQYHRPGHNNVQMECLITAKSGVTTYGMFKQALRELDTRVRGIKRMMIQLSILKRDADTLQFAAFEADLKNLDIQEMETSIEHSWREARMFYSQAKKLRSMLPEEMDVEYVESLEAGHLEAVLKVQCQLELVCNGAVSVGTLHNVCTMPPAQRDRLMRVINDGSVLARGALMNLPTPPRLDTTFEHITVEELKAAALGCSL